MDSKTLILGTGSPRRIQLFKQFGVEFKCATSGFDEDLIPTSLPPREYVKEIALGKANVLSQKYPDNPILTADTAVYFENQLYGKPKDRDDAFETLTKFRGKKHEVWTGLSLTFNGEQFTEEEKTTVWFNEVSDKSLWQYIDCFNPLDKAGSYAIQDAAGLLVNRIDGDYHNVIGFPLTKVGALLKHVGIDLWDYLNKPSLL